MSKRTWLFVAVLLLVGCGPEGYARIDPGGEYAYSNPAWSPDSRQIAYTRCALYDQEKGRNLAGCELFVMTVADRATRQLTDNAVYDGQPSWSPDGTQIVYRRAENAGDSLRVITVDGSGDVELLACPRSCQLPAWSPRENLIAFQMIESAARQDAPSNLYLIRSDGTARRRLTQNGSPVAHPRWSPDGTEIVFRRAADQPIRTIEVATGAEQAYATKDARGPDEPSFTPDGSGLVFSAYGAGQGTRLYRLDRASETIELLLAAADDYPPEMKEPAWSPDGKQIVFSAYYEKLYLADWEQTHVK
jgi:Tol biopolymer transport system component